MAVSYTELFVGLLAAYALYSVWVRLDPRYPVAGALLLLVAAALSQAADATDAANRLAEFAFLLLAAGVLLLLIDHLRAEPGVHPPEELLAGREMTGQGAHEGEPAPDEVLERLQEEPVAPVDAPGDDHHEDERSGDAEDQDRQQP